MESRYSGVLEGWIEDAPDDDHHDEHTLELKHHVSKIENKDFQILSKIIVSVSANIVSCEIISQLSLYFHSNCNDGKNIQAGFI